MKEPIVAGLATAESEIKAIMAFYRKFGAAQHIVRYPPERWAIEAIEKNTFFLLGAWCGNRVVGAAWISLRKQKVFFALEGDNLVLQVENRLHGEVGGMLVDREYRKRGVNSALCLAWWTFPAWRSVPPDFSFCARVAGVAGRTGPKFWEEYVAPKTGISFQALEDVPFDQRDAVVASHWKGGEIPYDDTIQKMIGKPSNRVVAGFQTNLPRWGLEWNGRTYTVTALTRYHEAWLWDTKVPPLIVPHARVLLSPG